MSTLATEIQKLLQLRDAGELTEDEFEAAKDCVLRPASHVTHRARSWNPFETFGRGLLTLIVAMGALIGGTTLLALTEVGAMALGALALVALAIIFVFLFREMF
ncbi:hypothetical protein SAMN05421539_11162 [Jannaschia seohaensis]|uniref:SHOCT domain-containing protein n=2 Tax=Jannaschia seohaensis TaxID=475081 RepID=A0A2Y9B063_9RHOB|nr:hypothetical protein BCF38_11162 [Jannaschia seohaensis]SSA49894.1 hypothetical protein SAMN05421539_11162 [Jannaschia seohaensis]